jgi:hypothetical protein
MTEVGLDNSKIPPGIDDIRNLEYYASGGDENAWLNFSNKKYYTNAFIVEDGKVFFTCLPCQLEAILICFHKLLLGWKKQGYGTQKQVLPTILCVKILIDI